jgi:hypothetical protein
MWTTILAAAAAVVVAVQGTVLFPVGDLVALDASNASWRLPLVDGGGTVVYCLRPATDGCTSPYVDASAGVIGVDVACDDALLFFELDGTVLVVDPTRDVGCIPTPTLPTSPTPETTPTPDTTLEPPPSPSILSLALRVVLFPVVFGAVYLVVRWWWRARRQRLRLRVP